MKSFALAFFVLALSATLTSTTSYHQTGVYGYPRGYLGWSDSLRHLQPYFQSSAGPYRIIKQLKAIVTLIPASGSGVNGTLHLQESSLGSGVLIKGEINGLTVGKHGFHVHMNGELTNDCKDAGGHFNPFMKSHGNPKTLQRHVGDLGNIKTFSENDPTKVLILDKLITLKSGLPNNIVGRAIVVHAGEDDLGQGGDKESLKTGNAGARVACGIIRKIPDEQPY